MKDNTFTVEGCEYAIIKPNGKQIRESKRIYNRTFANAVREKAFLRQNIREIAKEYNIWNEEKEIELNGIRAEIQKYIDKLDRGGIEINEARKYAIEINRLRSKVLDIVSALNDLDQMTAEGQAQDEAKNYLMSQCIVYKHNNKPYCSSVDDFYAKEEDPVVILGVAKYVQLENVDSLEFLETLPEIKFLKEYKFMDDNYNFIDEEGNKVDSEGNIINEIVEPIEKKPFLKNGEPINVG